MFRRLERIEEASRRATGFILTGPEEPLQGHPTVAFDFSRSLWLTSPRSVAFYDAVLSPLGYVRVWTHESGAGHNEAAAGYGTGGFMLAYKPNPKRPPDQVSPYFDLDS
ncbi:MAG TPA: hypothetical protein VE641_04685 [Chthoniobacterales bacterium]|nr:hypothetical protein [Chthoniobacterales bacterium]